MHTKNVEFSLNGFDILEFIVGRYNKICVYGVFDHILRFYSCQQSLSSNPKLKNKIYKPLILAFECLQNTTLTAATLENKIRFHAVILVVPNDTY